MPDLTSYAARVASQPENELFRFSYGKALFDAGDFTTAEEHLRVALERKPEWMVVTMLLAQCALRRNDQTEARRLYESALALAIAQHHEDPEAEIRAALDKLTA
jgi:Flp pilus assembly protein TadD